MPKDHLLQFRVKPKKKKEGKDYFKDFNPIYFSLGFYLLIPILLGIFLGIRIDKWLETKPFFTFLFIALGTISSFYNLWKLTKQQK